LKVELRTGDIAALAEVLRDLDAELAEVKVKLAEAKRKEAKPVAEAWKEVRQLASGTEDERIRLRTAIRRVVESITLLVVPLGEDRVAAVQVRFKDTTRHRDYLIIHKVARNNGVGEVKTVSTLAWDGELDLRDAADVARLEKVLATMEVAPQAM